MHYSALKLSSTKLPCLECVWGGGGIRKYIFFSGFWICYVYIILKLKSKALNFRDVLDFSKLAECLAENGDSILMNSEVRWDIGCTQPLLSLSPIWTIYLALPFPLGPFSSVLCFLVLLELLLLPAVIFWPSFLSPSLWAPWSIPLPVFSFLLMAVFRNRKHIPVFGYNEHELVILLWLHTPSACLPLVRPVHLKVSWFLKPWIHLPVCNDVLSLNLVDLQTGIQVPVFRYYSI